MAGDQLLLDQIGHLKKRAFSIIKNPLISLLPDEPPKEEYDSDILALLLFRACPANCSYPTLCVTIVKRGKSRMYLTILHNSILDGFKKNALH
jgi:hypothetical protein